VSGFVLADATITITSADGSYTMTFTDGTSDELIVD
jgi:hypothetical protein